MSQAISFTIIFRANSLNYGEGIGNISELKKIHRGNGDVLTFASRQSIRYDIVRLGNEWFEWNLQTVDTAKGTAQFRDEITIEQSEEMDLFGYLKTVKKKKKKEKSEEDTDNETGTSLKRPAVVRLSHAVSLEPYHSDMEFLNNMGLAERIGQTSNLVNIEQHDSFYTYTVTIDLARIGFDDANKSKPVSLSNAERSKRLHQLLDIIKLLNRNIRGRQETLAPLFIIGGVYPIANPFFLGRIMLEPGKHHWNLKMDALQHAAQTTLGGQKMADFTHVGYVSGIFYNEQQIKDNFAQTGTIEQFFSHLSQQINDYYGVDV